MKDKTIVYYPIFSNQLIISIICLLTVSALFYNLPNMESNSQNSKFSTIQIETQNSTIAIRNLTIITENDESLDVFKDIISKQDILFEKLQKQIQSRKKYFPFILGKGDPETMQMLHSKEIESVLTYNFNLITFQNVYTTNNNVFYTNNSLYTYSCNKVEPINGVFKIIALESVISYDINEINQSFENWMINVLPSFLLFPKSIMNKSFIISPRSNGNTIPMLKLAGISLDRMIELKNDEMIFSKKVFTFEQDCSTNFVALLNLRNIIVNKLKLDNSPPVLNVFTNVKGNSYHSSEAFNDIKNNFPQIIWTSIEFPTKLKEAIKIYNNIRLLVSPFCDKLANILFMQEKTCVCVVQKDLSDLTYVYISYIIGQYQYICVDEAMEKNSEIRADQIMELNEMITKAINNF